MVENTWVFAADETFRRDTQPTELATDRLLKASELPIDWNEQRRSLGSSPTA